MLISLIFDYYGSLGNEEIGNKSVNNFCKSYKDKLRTIMIIVWPLSCLVFLSLNTIFSIYLITSRYKMERRFISAVKDDL